MSNKLFMLSSHGGWDTNFARNLDNYKDLCLEVAKGILANLQDGDTAYIGYDGDPFKYEGPICYLFLKVIQVLLNDKTKAKLNVQPIVCQIASSIEHAIIETNNEDVNTLLTKYKDVVLIRTTLTEKRDKLKETIQLSYTENGDSSKVESAEKIEKNYQISINYGASYTPKLHEKEENPEAYKVEDFKFVFKRKTKKELGNDEDRYTFNDGRSDCYGGYTVVEGGSKKLVGSTAGWKLYLDKEKSNFEKIYYVPVWLNAVKKYEGSITHQITEVFNKFNLGDKGVIMPYINDSDGNRILSVGGSRKSKTLKKKKSKKRKSKSRKPLSKTLKMRKRKRSRRKRN